MIAQREKEEKEQSKRESAIRAKLPEIQFRRFATQSNNGTCYGCKMPMKWGRYCDYQYCQAPQSIREEGLIHDLRHLVRIIGVDECCRLLGYTTSNDATVAAQIGKKTAVS